MERHSGGIDAQFPPHLALTPFYGLFFPFVHPHTHPLQVFFQSLLEGFLTSIILFFIPYGAYHDSVDSGGADVADSSTFGVVVSSSLIMVVTLRVRRVGG